MAITPFWKQLFVASTAMLAAISVGGAASYPTVLLHQLRGNDSFIQLDFDTVSWIGSIHGLAGIPTIFLPHIMQWLGRKIPFIAAGVMTIIGWVIAYNAKSAAAILTSECFHGMGTNSVLTVTYLSLSEMMSPEYRHIYMNMYAVLQSFGMTLNGIMTQHIHWKIISVIMCVPMIIAVVLACLWPESPYWLALKGQYNKCEKAFVWLRGSDDEARKEMIELINAQKDHFVTHRNDKMSLRTLLKQISRRDFYSPCLHMVVLLYLFYWSGNVVIIIYSIQLIEKITQNPDAAFYGALIINSIIFVGIIINIVLLKFFKKKTILLCCSVLGLISMLCASLTSFLQTSGVISKSSLSCLFALIAYVIADGIGILPVAYAMAIEIMPVKHRGIGGSLTVICTCLFHTSALKTYPYLCMHIKMWGTFLFYSLNTTFCVLFIWRFVPDTSDKSLQDIEFYYNYGRFGKNKHPVEKHEILRLTHMVAKTENIVEC